MWYHVAEPTEYLVITGAGIKNNVKIVKKAFVMPGQRVTRLSISPFDFAITLQAMTCEKLSFTLPAVFTIGPEDQMEALEKYATLLTEQAHGHAGGNRVQDIVKGIIEGETRVIVSSMSIEEVFKERSAFKKKVIEQVQTELSQFGLKIYNANVKELADSEGSQYFQVLSRKAHEGALNTARVDVASARMKGEIGEKEKQGLTAQQLSAIEAQTAILETERKKEKAAAEASLAKAQTELDRDLRLTKIQAQRTAEAKDIELQRELEEKRALMELERLRASDLSKARAKKETQKENADADYYNSVKKVDAEVYKQEKSADAQFYKTNKETEAAIQRRNREIEANFLQKKRDAEAVGELAKGYAALSQAFGGPQGLLQYLMIEKDVYVNLAKAQASAISGLQPKMNIWTQGGSSEGDSIAPIRNLFTALPPLFQTIQEQTGMVPPTWMGFAPNTSANGSATASMANNPDLQAMIAKAAASGVKPQTVTASK